MRPALPATVVITQARHPLEGRDLRVLGWMRRLGRLELMLELPDGSKRLILAEHTSQHDDPDPGPGTGTLGRTADLLALSVLVSALRAIQLTGVEVGAAFGSCARAGSPLGVPGWAGGRCLASLAPCRGASCW